MASFWELFRTSVIVQGLLALLTTMAVLYALLCGLTVPPEMWTIYGIIIGWYFGAKGQQSAVDVARNMARRNHEGSGEGS